MFLQEQQELTYCTFPAACCLAHKTRSHQQVPRTNTSVQTYSQLHRGACPHVCCLRGRRGSSSPAPAVVAYLHTPSRQPAVNPRPTEPVCAVVGSDSCRQFVSTLGAFGQLWTTCKRTLLVFLHNSIPLEPHNILVIALGLETYFASMKAAMDLSFACFC